MELRRLGLEAGATATALEEVRLAVPGGLAFGDARVSLPGGGVYVGMACRLLPGGWGCGFGGTGDGGGGNCRRVTGDEVAVELPVIACPLRTTGLGTALSDELDDVLSPADEPLLLSLVWALLPELSDSSALERTEDRDSFFSLVISLTGALLLRTSPPCTLSPIRIFPYRD